MSDTPLASIEGRWQIVRASGDDLTHVSDGALTACGLTVSERFEAAAPQLLERYGDDARRRGLLPTCGECTVLLAVSELIRADFAQCSCCDRPHRLDDERVGRWRVNERGEIACYGCSRATKNWRSSWYKGHGPWRMLRPLLEAARASH